MAKGQGERWWLASAASKLTLFFFWVSLYFNYLFFVGNAQGFQEETQKLILQQLGWISFAVVVFAATTILTTFFARYRFRKKLRKIVLSLAAAAISGGLYLMISVLMVWIRA